MLLGAYVNNPWTIAPLYRRGHGPRLLRSSASRPTAWTSIDWDHQGLAFYRELLAHLRPYLWPYVWATRSWAVVGGLAAYFALRAFLCAGARRAASATP